MKGHFISTMPYLHEIFLLITFEQSYLEKMGSAAGNIERDKTGKYACRV